MNVLSKALYFKIFAVWLILNPIGSVFAISALASTVMGVRILIQSQTRSGIPSTGDREMGAIEQHLESIDDRTKAMDVETDKKFSDLGQQTLERRTENTAKWTQLADLLDRMNKRFDSEEADQRLYRERVIGDEKVVFGFLGCITFFGGASFLRKYFGSKQAISLVTVDDAQLENVVKPRRRSVPRAPISSPVPRKRTSRQKDAAQPL